MTSTEHLKKLTRFSRAVRMALVFAAVCAGLVGVSATQATAALPPAEGCPLTTTPGQYVYRCEIMYRALTWYNIRNNADMTYSMSTYHWDYNFSRKYRKDCSGFVGMAWHLNADPDSAGIRNYGTLLPSWKDLKPGDMLNYPRPNPTTPGHVILFKEWNDAAKTSFDFYAFGDTPIKLVLNETITGGSDGKIDGRSPTAYKPYRYLKVRDV